MDLVIRTSKMTFLNEPFVRYTGGISISDESRGVLEIQMYNLIDGFSSLIFYLPYVPFLFLLFFVHLCLFIKYKYMYNFCNPVTANKSTTTTTTSIT